MPCVLPSGTAESAERITKLGGGGHGQVVASGSPSGKILSLSTGPGGSTPCACNMTGKGEGRPATCSSSGSNSAGGLGLRSNTGSVG